MIWERGGLCASMERQQAGAGYRGLVSAAGSVVPGKLWGPVIPFPPCLSLEGRAALRHEKSS